MSHITIKDIARISGFSVSTVSRALNNHPDVSSDAREKIQKVIDEYDFVPNYNAKKLKQQADMNIAIIVKGRFNTMFSSILENIQERINSYGYSSEPHFIDENSNEVRYAIKIANENKPLAIIFLGGDIEIFKKHFNRISIPCILITNSAATLGFDNLSSVYTNDEQAAYRAVEYLVSNNHRKIAIIGGNLKKSFTSRLRFQGCKKCFQEHDIDFVESIQYQSARFSYESSYKAMIQLINKCPDVTAVFTMSDVMAIGAIRALRDLGKQVPDDISIIGFDGIELSKFYIPRLSTIVQAQDKLAKRGVDILISCIRGTAGSDHQEISFKLVKGESVKKLK